jgi:hypothetical protein
MTHRHPTKESQLTLQRALPHIRRFTLPHANATLPLVSRIVADVTATNTQYQSVRAQLRHTMDPTARSPLHTAAQQLIQQLQRLTTELNDIGCQLRDFSRGYVDFVSTYDGRDICLLWQPGQPAITHWHERDGYATNLHPIETLKSS